MLNARAASRRDAAVPRRRIVGLIWLYFALLVIEGALRKWILPQWSDALLIVRDPVAAAILFFAVRDGFLPDIGLVRSLGWLLVGFTLLAGLQLVVGAPLLVLVFGLRTYFLHPFVLFVIVMVLDARDIRRFALATLVLAIPITLLMVGQFNAGPADWINRGAGESGLQLRSAMGKVRPAGPFSFISGPALYFSLVLAALLAAQLRHASVSRVLLASVWASLLVAASISGSRSLVFGLIPVLIALTVVLVRQPHLVGRFVAGAVMVAVVVATLWASTIVQEGLEVFDARIQEAGAGANVVERTTLTYQYAAAAWQEAPLLGYGVGLGTNVANALRGTPYFNFGENEWTRTLFEAGPILGLAYMVWRVALAAKMMQLAMTAVAAGEALPLLLAAASLVNLVIGPWGQPTTQGFAVWSSGLCLATCRVHALERVRLRQAATPSARGFIPAGQAHPA